MALKFNLGLTGLETLGFLGEEETKRGLAPKFKGLLNGTETLGFLGGTPGWLITLTGEGRVSLEASVLSVANSLMVSMMESVLTPFFGCTTPALLLLLGIITSAISFLENREENYDWNCGTKYTFTLLMALAKGQSFFTSQFSLLDLYIHSLKVDGDKGVVWH